jgi:hypothetical protein
MTSRTWGARLSITDGLALLAGAVLTWQLHRALEGEARWLVGVPAVALGHFFLFCNVFRVPTYLELRWTALLLANVVAWRAADALAWAPVLALQTPITLLTLAATLRSPRYHGVGARRWNPSLDRWLAGELD